MAVAGFSPAELDITVQENTLLVTRKAQKEDENGGAYLHRGIARRTFERRFSLADHMKVVAPASTMACFMSTWFAKCPKQPSRARSRSALRSRRCNRRSRSKRRPNRHPEWLCPNVETPPNFGGVWFSAHKSAEQEGARSPHYGL